MLTSRDWLTVMTDFEASGAQPVRGMDDTITKARVALLHRKLTDAPPSEEFDTIRRRNRPHNLGLFRAGAELSLTLRQLLSTLEITSHWAIVSSQAAGHPNASGQFPVQHAHLAEPAPRQSAADSDEMLFYEVLP